MSDDLLNDMPPVETTTRRRKNLDDGENVVLSQPAKAPGAVRIGKAPSAQPAVVAAPVASTLVAKPDINRMGLKMDKYLLPTTALDEGVVARDDGESKDVITVTDVFKINFDTMAYTQLQKILDSVTKQEVAQHKALVEHEEHERRQKQQSQRVERFLDYNPSAQSNGSTSGASAAPAEGYAYMNMLNCLFDALNISMEGSAMKERNQLPVPVTEKIGKKKTVISNFARICAAFHRPAEDVKDFIEKELSTRGNLDSNSALILKFEIRKATDFDRILIKYLDEFVKCNSCHGIDTTLTKDGRRTELQCNRCTATRTVQAVSSATFSAQVEKRSRQRAAMTL